MESEESMRAMYYAPIPLLVLSSLRTIKMLNDPAEAILGTANTRCVGHKLERFVAEASRNDLKLALNDATERSIAAERSVHIATRVQLQNPDIPSFNFWADLSISAWFPHDPLSKQSPDTSKHATNKASPTSTRVPHEALYTISIVPSATIGWQDNDPKSRRTDMTNVLKESIFHCLDVGIVALSKDGKTEVRNQAFEKICSVSPEFTSLASNVQEDNKEADGGIIDAVDQTVTVWDANFEKVLETTEWPIYKCAFLGQSTPAVILGLESIATGDRAHVELVAKVLRDKAGYGEHIGGVVALRDVTSERQRQRIEIEQQSDLHFRQTVDLMPQLIWAASGTGYIEWYSQSYLDYTAYSQQELQGAGWHAIVQEDDLEEAGRMWSLSVRNGTRFEAAMRIRRHDGMYRHFLCRATPLKDAETGNVLKWYGTCTDIHDQVESFSASQRTQVQLQSVIKHAAVTLWAVDEEGAITVAEGPGVRAVANAMTVSASASPTAAASTNQEGSATDSFDRSGKGGSSNKGGKDSVVGRSIYTVWDGTDIRDSIQKALAGETVVGEMSVKGRWLRNSYAPLRAQGQDVASARASTTPIKDAAGDVGRGAIVGVVIASMDVTDRKEAQKQMEASMLEKTRALAAETAAREASRLKSEFLANMSHEIRTPIAGIIGLSELLLDEDDLSASQNEYAQTIQRSAEGLLTVINDVLDFSKVEMGKLEVEQVPLNLVVLLRDLKRMLTFTTQKKRLEFQEVLNVGYQDQLLGDLGRLRQVVTNLLTNAIKFTSHGSITLEVTELSANAESVLIRFDIRDTGCGIEPDILSRLFQPFSQADPSTARRFGGSGLGLSISKNLVELMGGKIGLDSVPGQGSHAWFEIPFRKAKGLLSSDDTIHVAIEFMQQASSDASQPSGGHYSDPSTGGLSLLAPTSLGRPRKDFWILIAEDNAVNAQIASKNVQKLGFSATVAGNGNVALEELSKRTYDLVLMDCQMPECDGYEATRVIRHSHNDDIRTLPVIALTASAIVGDRERAIEAGMVDYLAKPVKRQAMEATICKWLFDHNTRQTLSKFLPGRPDVKRHREQTG